MPRYMGFSSYSTFVDIIASSFGKIRNICEFKSSIYNPVLDNRESLNFIRENIDYINPKFDPSIFDRPIYCEHEKSETIGKTMTYEEAYRNKAAKMERCKQDIRKLLAPSGEWLRSHAEESKNEYDEYNKKRFKGMKQLQLLESKWNAYENRRIDHETKVSHYWRDFDNYQKELLLKANFEKQKAEMKDLPKKLTGLARL
jgi:ElaB/YqjD/DUF883 family membrane-anchored ribosome-binding protein